MEQDSISPALDLWRQCMHWQYLALWPKIRVNSQGKTLFC